MESTTGGKPTRNGKLEVDFLGSTPKNYNAALGPNQSPLHSSFNIYSELLPFTSWQR
jgi:hypothetical protein